MVYVMNPPHSIHCALCTGQYHLVKASDVIVRDYMNESGFPGLSDASAVAAVAEEGLGKQWVWYLPL